MYQLEFMVAKDRKFSLSKKEFYVSENPLVEVALVGMVGRIRKSCRAGGLQWHPQAVISLHHSACCGKH